MQAGTDRSPSVRASGRLCNSPADWKVRVVCLPAGLHLNCKTGVALEILS
ncbi:MAG: hypothetical protein OXH92_14840 [Bryobacterales bacterium]|nr:hypothetical protein [Bryobacterales bacterium]MDE0435278.1 hypothetical protein [Bryobacterales bacterium]